MVSCAACGKADGSFKACTACKLVKYCGVDCQVAHRSMHKNACRIRAAELFDVKLFEQPPRREDCPICCIPMPPDDETIYMNCCGKFICNGCGLFLTRDVCPYCNTPTRQSHEEHNNMYMERIKRFNDANAMNSLGCNYNMGENGFPVDQSKAVELYRRASENGSALGHSNLGNSYFDGTGVEQDMKKAVHHWQIAAMKGQESSRYNLGVFEAYYGTMERAMRHYMIAAKCGHDKSLQEVKDGFMHGKVTKEDLEKTLRGHQASQDEMKSDQRDFAKSTEYALE